MKAIVILSFLFLVNAFYGQTKSEIKIKTSAQCNMCKERIEKRLKKEKGVYEANLDLETKVVTILYDSLIIKPDKLRFVISSLGYQADDIKADPIAYEKLPKCCKLPVDRNN